MSQMMEALEQANRIRFARARIKTAMREGTISFGRALDLEPVQTMTVLDLLRVPRGWGYHRAGIVLREVGISHTYRVADVTSRQRRLLVASVARRTKAPPVLDLGAPAIAAGEPANA